MGDPLPLSIVEHYAYCPRQAALIHVEAQWQSNADTAQGEVDHAAVDRGVREVTREGIVTWLSLPVWSDSLGLQGLCDVVEFCDGAPRPVEHKPKWRSELVGPAAQQLAVQAICLEEMLGIPVTEGFLFTRRDARRHLVAIDEQLRCVAAATAASCHDLVDQQLLPPPVDDRRCRNCSLAEPCGLSLGRSNNSNVFKPAPLGDW